MEYSASVADQAVRDVVAALHLDGGWEQFVEHLPVETLTSFDPLGAGR